MRRGCRKGRVTQREEDPAQSPGLGSSFLSAVCPLHI